MAASSSVAQFMALMTGIKPSAAREQYATQDQNADAGIFNQLVNGQNTDHSLQELQQAVQAAGQNVAILKGDQTANTTQLSQGDLQNLRSILNSLNISNGDVLPTQFLGNNQAQIEQKIVLDLSSRGVNDDVIQQLLGQFDLNDLHALLNDPKLSQAFNNFVQTSLSDDELVIDDGLPVLETDGDKEPANVSDVEDKGQDIDNETSNVIDFVAALLTHNETSAAAEDVIAKQLISDKQDIDQINAALNVMVDGLDDGVVPITFVMPQSMQKQNQAQSDLSDAAHNALTALSSQSGDDMPPVTGGQNPFMKQPVNVNNGDVRLGTESYQTPNQYGAQSMAGANSASSGGEMAQSIADRLSTITSGGSDVSSQAFSDASMDGFIAADGETIMADFGGEAAFVNAFKTAANSANLLTSTPQASQSHPASQMVALSLTKIAAKATDSAESQSYRLRLDPPELGRLDIELDIAKDNKQLKAVINVEKSETLNMLQRDMHTLVKAMHDAGFENISNQDISFNLSPDSQQDMAQNNRGEGQSDGSYNADHKNNAEGDNIELVIESEMSVIIDPITGQQSVNMLV